mgnify:CR=1 FL=1
MSLLTLLAIVFYTLVLGWRGVGEAGVAWIDTIRAANQAALSDKPWTLATPHPGLDLLGIPLLAIGESSRLAALGWVSAICTGLTVPAVWMLGHRLGREWGAISACVLFLGLPVVTGAATTTSPGAVVLMLWTWFFALSTRAELSWRGWLAVCLLAGVLAVSWAPFLIWLAAWFLLVLVQEGRLAQAEGRESASPGFVGASTLPVGLVATLLVGIAAPIGIVMLGAGDLAAGFEALLRQGLLTQTETVLFAGESFSKSRPPLVAGVSWWLIQSPSIFVVLAAFGFVGGTERGRAWLDEHVPSHVEQGFALGLIPLVLAFLWLIPWLTRARAFGGVDPVLLGQPIMAALAGAAITWMVAGLVERLRDSLSGRILAAIAGVMGAVAFAPGLVESARLHPLQSAHYNVFVGGTDGAVEAGFPPTTDDTLPTVVAVRLAELAGAQPVDPGPYRRQIEAMVHDRIIPPVAFADKKQQPDLILRLRGPLARENQPSPFKRAQWSAGDAVVFEVLVMQPPPAE